MSGPRHFAYRGFVCNYAGFPTVTVKIGCFNDHLAAVECYEYNFTWSNPTYYQQWLSIAEGLLITGTNVTRNFRMFDALNRFLKAGPQTVAGYAAGNWTRTANYTGACVACLNSTTTMLVPDPTGYLDLQVNNGGAGPCTGNVSVSLPLTPAYTLTPADDNHHKFSVPLFNPFILPPQLLNANYAGDASNSPSSQPNPITGVSIPFNSLAGLVWTTHWSLTDPTNAMNSRLIQVLSNAGPCSVVATLTGFWNIVATAPSAASKFTAFSPWVVSYH